MYGRVPGFACFSCSSFHWLHEFECIRSPFCSFDWFIKSYFTKIVEIWSKCHYIVRDVSSEVYTSSLCVTDVDLSIMVCGIIDGDPGIRMCGSTWGVMVFGSIDADLGIRMCCITDGDLGIRVDCITDGDLGIGVCLYIASGVTTS